MFGKLAGALIGQRVAGRISGAKGAIIGDGVAALARRGLGPLAGALALGWGQKSSGNGARAGGLIRLPGRGDSAIAAGETKSPS